MFLCCFLTASLSKAFAEESITVQKTSSGEVQIQKQRFFSEKISSDLLIEILTDSPRIETTSPPASPLPISKPILHSLPSEPIQITIQGNQAFIVWKGRQYQIALDPQGRFNLQLSSPLLAKSEK